MVSVTEYINTQPQNQQSVEQRLMREIRKHSSGMSIGVLFNRFRRIPRDDIGDALDKMASENLITVEEIHHSINGRKTLIISAK